MQCRACLQTNCKNTSRLDELKITSINLITNLCIHKGDSMPQQLCENCTKDLKFCVEFREKCITSNTILLSAQTSSKDLSITTVKQEDVTDDFKHEVHEINEMKINTKEEIEENEYSETPESEDNFEYEFISDINQQNTEDSSAQTCLLKESTKKPRAKARAVKKKSTNDAKYYDCGLCAKKIEKKKLSEHVKSHEKDNTCGVCSLSFKEWGEMLQHRVSHLNKPHLICHICSRSHPSRLSLECHYDIKHSDNTDDVWECRACHKRVSSSRALYKHVRAVHAAKTFACTHCPKVFATARILKNHEFKAHEKNKKCGECHFTTESLSSLKQHRLRAHAAGAAGVASCPLCRTPVAGAAQLLRHRCVDSSDATVCAVCGVMFPTPAQLREHQATHSAARRYRCARCDATYRSWRGLRVHASKHDGVRRFTCDLCPRAFWSRPTLVKHRRVHTGERPYVCKLCSKGFSANHNLKVHMRVHGIFDLIKKKTTAADDPADDGEITKKHTKKLKKKSSVDS